MLTVLGGLELKVVEIDYVNLGSKYMGGALHLAILPVFKRQCSISSSPALETSTIGCTTEKTE